MYRPDGTAYSGAKGHHTAFAAADALDLRAFQTRCSNGSGSTAMAISRLPIRPHASTDAL